MSSMRRSPRQRDLQALDLRTYDIGAERQLPHAQNSVKDARLSATPRPRPTTPKQQFQQPRAESRLGKGNSSSEQSINKGLSRSQTMIDLPSPRANPLRLCPGYDHFSAEEEEVKQFYRSIDPSIAFDELELEPPRPTSRQTARLCAGASHNSSRPPRSSNVSPNNYNSRSPDQSSRLQNFSSFYPPAAMSGPGHDATGPSYPPSPRRRSSMEQYSSIPPRPQSTICPSTSPWLMPVAQSSPMRQPTPTPTSNRDTSSFLYEPPRRNDYSSRTPMNSTRYRGLPGQPFKMPGLAPQAMATQWITPPGRMPFPFLQQSSLGQPRDSIQHSHWDPSLRPPDIERPMTYSQKEELACPTESPNLPCEGAESNEEKFTAPPPRCRELDPEIRKKLSSDLPPFKIPRGLEDDFVCIKRRELWESLVKDQYCPGAIQATIDGHVNFNALAYDIVFGDFRLPDCLPHLDPISLLEAFFIRINYERCQVKKLEELTYASADPDDEQKTPPTSVDCSIIEKCFKHKHPTELNAAIEKLLIAEKLHDFDKPEPEIPLMNLTLDKLSTDLPGTPITIQAFMGTTKPRNPT